MKTKYKKMIFALFGNLTAALCTLHAQEYSAAVQEKLLLPFAEIRSSQDFENYNFGAAIFTSGLCKKFPCQFKTGNLISGSALSKLNSPSLSSSISPFSSVKTDALVITASLPGIAAYSKPVTYFSELCYADKKSFFSETKLNCFYNPDDDFPVFSARQIITPHKKISVAASMTAGEFSYEENTFSSWFTTSDFYYHKGKHICALPQLSLKTPYFSSLFSVPLYESPFGKINSAWKSENKIIAGHFCFTLSAFYNDSPLLTSNETVIKEIFQTRFGMISSFAVGKTMPLFLKTGFNSYTQINLSDTEHKFKFALGTRLTAQRFSISLLSNANFTFICEKPGSNFSADMDSLAFQFLTYLHFQKIAPSVAAAVTFYPEDDYESLKTTQKLSLNFTFNKNPKITLSGSYSFTQQDGETLNQTLSANLNANWKLKCLSLTGKIGISIEN